MLEKIKILDLSRILAGPYCTQMLGDLGAQITKIEHIKGDDTRNWGPPFFHSESAYFLAVNRNKKSVTLDFKSKKGLEILKKLVVESDVLVENYMPGKLDSLGLGYDEMKKLNPKLIYASITGYGPEGPYSKKAGYDVIIEGEAGLMHITGEDNPVKVGVAITDITTGLYAKGAILGNI
jgi:succinate---hydroxymethylglutarate CoA-transferase